MTIRMVCICGATEGGIDPNCERCRFLFLLKAVSDMRQAQIAFFRDRTSQAMEDAKRCERIVDKTLKRLLEVQPELFDTTEG